MGQVYDGSMVGRSEGKSVTLQKTAESLFSTAILFIDKARQVLPVQWFITELRRHISASSALLPSCQVQEKTSPVFVMATANRVERLGEFF